jgi:hypothetical protein
LPPIQAGSPFNEDFLECHHITAVTSDRLFLTRVRQETVSPAQGDFHTLVFFWIKLLLIVNQRRQA